MYILELSMFHYQKERISQENFNDNFLLTLSNVFTLV